MKYHLLAATALSAVGIAASTPASAIPIVSTFNFVPFGTFSSNGAGGDVSLATAITGGQPYLTTTVSATNINLLTGTTITLPNVMPTVFGATFTKTFITSLGTFTESLTVDLVSPSPSALAVTAHGIISSTNAGFDPTPVFYAASYTQNGGPTAQINGSFNDSTTPPPPPPPPPPSPTPEPASLALLAGGLAGLGAVRRRKR